MPQITHEKLGVALRKDDSGNYYEFGVVVDGAFVPFASGIAGHIDPILEEAAKSKSEPSTEG